jgi:hypothetical protein
MSYCNYGIILDDIKHVQEGYHGVLEMDRGKYGICFLLGVWCDLTLRLYMEFILLLTGGIGNG